LKTLLPDEVSSVMMPLLPQAISQLPPDSLRELPQQIGVGVVGSFASSTSVAVLALRSSA
jgi:hypothetical protein